MATPKQTTQEKYEKHKSMIVLTASGMKSRFKGTEPKSLIPLMESLRTLDPKQNSEEYNKTLKRYLDLTKSG